MNEMFAYLALADVVFVGGSLVPVGGHNLIEACALGKPVIMGASTFNFADAASRAHAAGAMISVESAAALIATAASLVHDAARCAAMAASALAFTAAHRGATQRTMAALTPHLKL
jgi:3-deoxy-D-manno-octulosonic-acid transferase